MRVCGVATTQLDCRTQRKFTVDGEYGELKEHFCNSLHYFCFNWFLLCKIMKMVRSFHFCRCTLYRKPKCKTRRWDIKKSCLWGNFSGRLSIISQSIDGVGGGEKQLLTKQRQNKQCDEKRCFVFLDWRPPLHPKSG